MGCGSGNLRAALRSRGWDGYFIGVDVSEQAIEVARKSEDDSAEWYICAIEEFPILNRKVSVICLCESIYYVPLRSVLNMLLQCSQFLISGGRIVVRIWHADRHREYVALLVGLGARCDPPIYVITKE